MEDTSPVRRLARGVALVVGLTSVFGAGCSPYIGTTAASFLRRVRNDPDPNVRYLAYAKLAQPDCYDTLAQRDEAVRTLIAKLDEGKEPVASRAVIVQTLGELGEAVARDVVLKATNDPEPVIRVQACRALGKVGRTEDATVLARIMTTDTLEDCRIAAIEALGVLKPKDPRMTQVLIAAMQHDDPATRFASLNALRRITGKDYGVEAVAWAKALTPPPDADPAPKTLLASPSPSPSSAPATASAPSPSSPVYPPRLVPIPSAPATASAPSPSSPVYPPRLVPIPDPAVDLDAQTAGFSPNPPASASTNYGRGTITPSPSSSGSYPSRNPNLAAPPAGR
jgi:hypothetical protein